MQTPILQPGRSTTAHDPLFQNWIMRGGLIGPTLFVENFTYPREVQPGDAIDCEFTIRSTGGFALLDPDSCTQGVNKTGILVDGKVEIAGDTDSVSKCVQGAPIIGVNDRTGTMTVRAPDKTGTYDLDVTFQTPNGEGGTRTFVVTVTSGNGTSGNGDGGREPGSPVEPPQDGDSGDGAPAGLIEQLFGRGVGVGFAGGLAFLLIVLVLLIAVGGE